MTFERGGYIVHVARPGPGRVGPNAFFRDWWLVKYKGGGCCGVSLGSVTLPNSYAGKKVRFKIEVIE